MNDAIMQMMGYLTEEQWIDAYKNADGIHYKKEDIKNLYLKTCIRYNTNPTNKCIKTMNI